MPQVNISLSHAEYDWLTSAALLAGLRPATAAGLIIFDAYQRKVTLTRAGVQHPPGDEQDDAAARP
jgi:hypothetical protein